MADEDAPVDIPEELGEEVPQDQAEPGWQRVEPDWEQIESDLRGPVEAFGDILGAQGFSVSLDADQIARDARAEAEREYSERVARGHGQPVGYMLALKAAQRLVVETLKKQHGAIRWNLVEAYVRTYVQRIVARANEAYVRTHPEKRVKHGGSERFSVDYCKWPVDKIVLKAVEKAQRHYENAHKETGLEQGLVPNYMGACSLALAYARAEMAAKVADTITRAGKLENLKRYLIGREYVTDEGSAAECAQHAVEELALRWTPEREANWRPDKLGLNLLYTIAKRYAWRQYPQEVRADTEHAVDEKPDGDEIDEQFVKFWEAVWDWLCSARIDRLETVAWYMRVVERWPEEACAALLGKSRAGWQRTFKRLNKRLLQFLRLKGNPHMATELVKFAQTLNKKEQEQ